MAWETSELHVPWLRGPDPVGNIFEGFHSMDLTILESHKNTGFSLETGFAIPVQTVSWRCFPPCPRAMAQEE